MGTGFDVDVRALQTLARDLGQALHSMAAARGELAAASDGQTGDGALDRACGEFQGKWGYGLTQLEKTTGAFAIGLEETVKAYEAVEGELQKSFGGGSGSAGGGSHGVLMPITHGGGRIPTPRLLVRPTPDGGSAQ